MLHPSVANISVIGGQAELSQKHNDGATMMTLSTHRDNSSQRMLETIDETNSLCYHAQCHFRQASSLAADGPCTGENSTTERKNEPLIKALQEARLGSDKLEKSFSLVLENVMLVRNHPVLASQVGSIPKEDLQGLETSSEKLLANIGKHKDDRIKERKLLKHCGSILRFVNRCEEIAGQQRKLLEAVAVQIKPIVVKKTEASFYHNNKLGYSHQYDRYNDHVRSEPYNVPIREVETERIDPIPIIPNPRSRHQKVTAQVGGVGTEQWCLSNPHPSSVTLPPAPVRKPTDDFEPLPIDQGIDLPSSETDDELEPLSIDDVINLSLEEEVITASFPSAGTFIDTSNIHGNRWECQQETLSTPTVPKRTNRSPRSTDEEKPRIRRVGSGGLLEKRRRNRRPPRRQPKPKGRNKEPSSDDVMKLALGGRLDFMQKDTVFKEDSRRRRSSDTNESEDASLEFPFDDDRPACRRWNSY